MVTDENDMNLDEMLDAQSLMEPDKYDGIRLIELNENDSAPYGG